MHRSKPQQRIQHTQQHSQQHTQQRVHMYHNTHINTHEQRVTYRSHTQQHSLEHRRTSVNVFDEDPALYRTAPTFSDANNQRRTARRRSMVMWGGDATEKNSNTNSNHDGDEDDGDQEVVKKDRIQYHPQRSTRSVQRDDTNLKTHVVGDDGAVSSELTLLGRVEETTETTHTHVRKGDDEGDGVCDEAWNAGGDHNTGPRYNISLLRRAQRLSRHPTFFQKGPVRERMARVQAEEIIDTDESLQQTETSTVDPTPTPDLKSCLKRDAMKGETHINEEDGIVSEEEEAFTPTQLHTPTPSNRHKGNQTRRYTYTRKSPPHNNTRRLSRLQERSVGLEEEKDATIVLPPHRPTHFRDSHTQRIDTPSGLQTSVVRSPSACSDSDDGTERDSGDAHTDHSGGRERHHTRSRRHTHDDGDESDDDEAGERKPSVWSRLFSAVCTRSRRETIGVIFDSNSSIIKATYVILLICMCLPIVVLLGSASGSFLKPSEDVIMVGSSVFNSATAAKALAMYSSDSHGFTDSNMRIVHNDERNRDNHSNNTNHLTQEGFTEPMILPSPTYAPFAAQKDPHPMRQDSTRTDDARTKGSIEECRHARQRTAVNNQLLVQSRFSVTDTHSKTSDRTAECGLTQIESVSPIKQELHVLTDKHIYTQTGVSIMATTTFTAIQFNQ